MRPVNSSNLSSVGYDSWSATLVIAFRNGSVYQYYQVPHAEYHGLMNASSHGKYFHRHIRDRYSYQRVS
jgi:hypothetical protein